jgi:hypothetical protein
MSCTIHQPSQPVPFWKSPQNKRLNEIKYNILRAMKDNELSSHVTKEYFRGDQTSRIYVAEITIIM